MSIADHAVDPFAPRTNGNGPARHGLHIDHAEGLFFADHHKRVRRFHGAEHVHMCKRAEHVNGIRVGLAGDRLRNGVPLRPIAHNGQLRAGTIGLAKSFYRFKKVFARDQPPDIQIIAHLLSRRGERRRQLFRHARGHQHRACGHEMAVFKRPFCAFRAEYQKIYVSRQRFRAGARPRPAEIAHASIVQNQRDRRAAALFAGQRDLRAGAEEIRDDQIGLERALFQFRAHPLRPLVFCARADQTAGEPTRQIAAQHAHAVARKLRVFIAAVSIEELPQKGEPRHRARQGARHLFHPGGIGHFVVEHQHIVPRTHPSLRVFMQKQRSICPQFFGAFGIHHRMYENFHRTPPLLTACIITRNFSHVKACRKKSRTI